MLGCKAQTGRLSNIATCVIVFTKQNCCPKTRDRDHPECLFMFSAVIEATITNRMIDFLLAIIFSADHKNHGTYYFSIVLLCPHYAQITLSYPIKE